MQIDELWAALEADAVGGSAGSGGWLLRLARSVAGCPLFVGLELASRRRAILLQLPEDTLPARRLWPRSKGLEPLAVSVEGNSYFGVVLKESRFLDVFTALAEDLARRVSEVDNSESHARVFLGQLARWQKFLSASVDGLSEESQRGLWGELRFLREQLLPALGPSAVSGWKGGERAHQDFQFQEAAVEVKTTLAKQPQIVRITSERQLDCTAWKVLFLNVISLDMKDGVGETLPAMVASLRAKMASDATASEQFEDELLMAGFLDAHALRYSGRGYTVRSVNSFRVSPGFPCLVEAQMPVGVGDVSYDLTVAACEPFKVSTDAISASLVSSQNPTHGRRKRG
ncbi:MAG: PD-(D/E)XK motif protein [Tepidisphaeraceae bacterium]|jgi:hypothetical protein